MKQFLAFLLIAIVACTTVDIDLESWWDSIVDFFSKGWNWLKENGLIDIIIDTLKKAGKEAAINLCANWLDRSICEAVIGSLL